MWLAPNCSSMPSGVRARVSVMTAALLMMRSMAGVSFAMADAALRMESCEERSSGMVAVRVVGWAERRVDCTVVSLEGVREARIRRVGDWEAMERAVVEPMLEGETPVMRTVLLCLVGVDGLWIGVW